MSNETPVFDARTRGDQPSTAVDNGTTAIVPREPEKLTLSVEAVSDLLVLAVQSPGGNAWWRGFVAAHGVPSWIVQGRWRIVPEGGAEVVQTKER